jgi:hypothetical protein
MKTYILNLGGQHSQICANIIAQANDFVSFYRGETANTKELVALVRMSPGDIIVEKSATPGEQKCPDCGHAPYERGKMKTYVTNK